MCPIYMSYSSSTMSATPMGSQSLLRTARIWSWIVSQTPPAGSVLTSSRPFTTATNSEFGIRSEGSSSSIETSATNLCSPRPSATFTKPGLPGPSTAAASLLSKPICTIAATLCQPSGAGQSGGLWAGGPGEIFQIFSHPFTLTTQPVLVHSTHKNTEGAPRLGRVARAKSSRSSRTRSHSQRNPYPLTQLTKTRRVPHGSLSRAWVLGLNFSYELIVGAQSGISRPQNGVVGLQGGIINRRKDVFPFQERIVLQNLFE